MFCFGKLSNNCIDFEQTFWNCSNNNNNNKKKEKSNQNNV